MTANISRRTLLAATGATALIGTATPAFGGTPSPAELLKGGWQPSREDKALVGRWARDTWRSMVAMTDEHTGLPADFVSKGGTRSTPTSPTNIGAYLWSAVAAERLGISGHREAVARPGVRRGGGGRGPDQRG